MFFACLLAVFVYLFVRLLDLIVSLLHYLVCTSVHVQVKVKGDIVITVMYLFVFFCSSVC